MDFPLLAILAFATFALVIAFALWSKARTEDRIDAAQAKKSSLAKDGPGPNPFHPER